MPANPEDDDDITFVTSPVIFSILGGVMECEQVETSGDRAYWFHFHPVLLNYIREYILKKSETCCKNNPYQIKMKFTCDADYKSNLEEELLFLNELRNKMKHSSHSLFPYISQQFNSTREQVTCLLCGRNFSFMDIDCCNCRVDMCVFLEIMHDSSNWIPMGWQYTCLTESPPPPFSSIFA